MGLSLHSPEAVAAVPPRVVIESCNRFTLDAAFLARYSGQQPEWGPLGYVVHKRTYARRVGARSEEFWETLQRVTEGTFSLLKQQIRSAHRPWDDAEAQRKAQDFYARMWEFKWLPPGRGLWIMGTDYLEKHGGGAANNCFAGSEMVITEKGVLPISESIGAELAVLTAKGWVKSKFKCFGVQPLQAITFAPADRSATGVYRALRSNVRRVVKATSDHRWMTLHRGAVTDIRVGDFVPAQVNEFGEINDTYKAGFVHGLVFGDGTYHRTVAGEHRFSVRLCGKKVKHVGNFSHVTWPKTYNGDPLCNVNSATDLKSFPDDQHGIDYTRGFLDGWLATDGSKQPSGSVRLTSQDPVAAEWLNKNAAAAGWLLVGDSFESSTETNYGKRSAPLRVFVLSDRTTNRAWKVVGIETLDVQEPVFCPQVPDIGMFTLAAGIYTSNCGFVSTSDLARDFADPFCALMDWSMLGVGMGFDTRGAGALGVVEPRTCPVYVVEDTREGWIDLIRVTLLAYVGQADLPEVVDVSKVRPEGEPIHGFGGTASGPGPLLDLWRGVRRILSALIGQRITSAAITDLMNMIGRCVVAGNVRRSSEIALGDIHDEDFLALKDPARDREIQAQQTAIELTHGIDLEDILQQQQMHSPLSVEFAEWQTKIDAVKAQRYSIPEWAALDAERWALPLNAWRWASNNTVWGDHATGADLRRIGERIAHNGEPGVGWLDLMRSHGRLADAPTHDDQFAVGMNPCAEQTLWDRELCCLVETFPTKHLRTDGTFDMDDYKLTLKMAYLYAKVVSGIPTHRPDTNAVMAANRRIGTSQAGVAELYETIGLSECRRIWDEGYRYITVLDAEYSRWMACPRSIKRTSIKPGGSIPLLPGIEGGMKWASAAHYMRTVRIDRMSPMVSVLQRLGYRVEPDHYTPRSMVVYFPVRSTAQRFAGQVSVWEQAELAAALQAHWSDNMVSCTITFKRNEAADVPRVIEAFAGRLKVVSFLPISEHGYLQAPYIPCSEAEYNAAVASITGDLAEALSVALNGTDTKEEDERFCSGDRCEIKRPA